MRTIPRQHPSRSRHWLFRTRNTEGDYKARCDICGTRWLRSRMTPYPDGTLRCPRDAKGLDAVTLNEIAAENAARYGEFAAELAGMMDVGAVGSLPNPPAAEVLVDSQVDLISGLVEHFKARDKVLVDRRLTAWGSAHQEDADDQPYSGGPEYRDKQFLWTPHAVTTAGSLVLRARVDVAGALAGTTVSPYPGYMYISSSLSGPNLRFSCGVGERSGATHNTDYLFAVGVWYEVALTWDGTTVTILVGDGTTATSRYSGAQAGTPVGSFCLGGYGSGAKPVGAVLTGDIRQAVIFAKAITLAEMQIIVDEWNS